MRVLTHEIKAKIRTLARFRLKDNLDVTIPQEEVNGYSKFLEDLWVNGEFELPENEEKDQ